jgi:CHAD domain-containing protein
VAYRLNLDEPIGAAVAATADERLEHAIEQLRGTAADDRTAAIHDARKDLKKLRSLLRLIGPGVKRRDRRRENTAFAEAGRSLAVARDADVMVELVDDLVVRGVGQVPESTFAALRQALCDAAQDARGEVDDATLDATATELEAARERIAGWPLEKLRDAALIEGMVRSYARGRAELAVALESDPSAEHLHEWRKRVKDLWYEQRLLRDAWPAVMRAQIDELDRLAKLLGDDHDLFGLRELLASGDGAAAHVPADLEPLIAYIDGRRADILAQARSTGNRVYADKPDAFERRHAAYLEAARADRVAPAPAVAPAADA